MDDIMMSKEAAAGPAGGSCENGKAKSSKASSNSMQHKGRRQMDDSFMMYMYKIKLCTRTTTHNWKLCPWAHPGETAALRRHPSCHRAELCPAVRQHQECPHDETCEYSRNAFESWLHPDRYRTTMCSSGEACMRNICFFAHNAQELRAPADQATPAPQAQAQLQVPLLWQQATTQNASQVTAVPSSATNLASVQSPAAALTMQANMCEGSSHSSGLLGHNRSGSDSGRGLRSALLLPSDSAAMAVQHTTRLRTAPIMQQLQLQAQMQPSLVQQALLQQPAALTPATATAADPAVAGGSSTTAAAMAAAQAGNTGTILDACSQAPATLQGFNSSIACAPSQQQQLLAAAQLQPGLMQTMQLPKHMAAIRPLHELNATAFGSHSAPLPRLSLGDLVPSVGDIYLQQQGSTHAALQNMAMMLQQVSMGASAVPAPAGSVSSCSTVTSTMPWSSDQTLSTQLGDQTLASALLGCSNSSLPQLGSHLTLHDGLRDLSNESLRVMYSWESPMLTQEVSPDGVSSMCQVPAAFDVQQLPMVTCGLIKLEGLDDDVFGPAIQQQQQQLGTGSNWVPTGSSSCENPSDSFTGFAHGGYF